MLTELPPEVILNISCYLGFKDKLTLVKTCHKLYNIISKWNLYEELSLSPLRHHNHTQPHISRFVVRKFKNNILNGTQVKALKLNLSGLSNQLYRRLPTIFPNVTELINTTGTEPLRNQFVLEPLSQWKDTLERYDMVTSGYLEILKLLETYTFTRLSYLNISPVAGTNKIKIADMIKKVPYLSQLRLYNIAIEYTSLVESIHQHCPRLESLTLSSAILFIDEINLPASIEPANNFKRLRFEESTLICDTNALLFDYIIAKYPFLTQLEFFFSFENTRHDHYFPNYLEQGTLIQARQHATNRQADIKKTQKLYQQGAGNRFLSRLPSTVNTIKLDTTIFDNVITSLDHAHLLETLSTLELRDRNNNPSIVFKDTLDFECFYRMTSLKTLTAGVSVEIKDYEDNMNVLTNLRTVNLAIAKPSSPLYEPPLQLNRPVQGQNWSTPRGTVTRPPVFRQAQTQPPPQPQGPTVITIDDDSDDDTKPADTNSIKMDWLLSTFPNMHKFHIEQTDVTLQTEGLVRTRSYPHLTTFTIRRGSVPPDFLHFLRVLAPNLKHLGYVIRGDAYQVHIPRNYFRDKKHANKAGKKNTIPELPEQICFYVDLKGYLLLDTFQLFMDLNVNPGFGTAYISVEVVKPSVMDRHIYARGFNTKTQYARPGKGAKPFELRGMTKVMVVCNSVLKTFQVDSTHVIKV